MRWREGAAYLAILLAGGASVGTTCAGWSAEASSAWDTVVVPAGGEVATTPLTLRSNGDIAEIRVSLAKGVPGIVVELMDADTGIRTPVASFDAYNTATVCRPTSRDSLCPSRIQLVFSNPSQSEPSVSFSIGVTGQSRGCGGEPIWVDVGTE
jgi:hypothetical protein